MLSACLYFGAIQHMCRAVALPGFFCKCLGLWPALSKGRDLAWNVQITEAGRCQAGNWGMLIEGIAGL